MLEELKTVLANRRVPISEFPWDYWNTIALEKPLKKGKIVFKESNRQLVNSFITITRMISLRVEHF